jgi:putative transport protein
MFGIGNLLATSVPALLFAVIGLGYFLGNIKIRGFTLGIASVLFVGLVFGALDRRFVIPEEIYVLGLTLFVYTIGLQSGPTFFSIFRRQWVRLTLLALIATGAAAGVTALGARLLGIDAPVAAGLFCGGLTNTPALAAAVETLRQILAGAPLDPQALRLQLDGPTVGYSISYPFGVLGLILTMQLATKLYRVDFSQERQRAKAAEGGEGQDLITRELRVTNPQLVGKPCDSSLLTELTGMVFTRVQCGPRIELVTPDVILAEGCVLVGVGTTEAVRKAELLIGPIVHESVERQSPGIVYRDFVVVNRGVAGTPLSHLAAAGEHPVIVSRIRRGAVQITPHSDTTLELGDQIRVVARRADLAAVAKFVGNPLRDVAETDFLSFSLGLILGVALGMLPLPFFGDRPVRLGFAGGPLIVALILGRLGRTGPIVWTMQTNVNLTLRQLGILFFLAGVGTRAGGSFVQTFLAQGPVLLLFGAGITLLSAGLVTVIASRFFGYDMISTFGILAGVHTQPAALAFANAHTGSEHPNISYAAVYPVALIAKIILAQVLVGL